MGGYRGCRVSRVRGDPLLHEAKLPAAVARYVKNRGLYGRDGRRGFHELPPHLVRWLTWEQALNDRAEDLSIFPDSIQKDNGLKADYLPEQRPVFWIETAEIPVHEARILATGDIPRQLFVKRGGQHFVRFFIHPQSKGFFKKSLARYRVKREYLATPTASHRSLVVWNPDTSQPPLGIKVSLDVRIGGMRRLVTSGQIERAAAASALIRTIAPDELKRLKIRFFDEPAGVMPKDFGYGFGLRDLPESLPRGIEIVPLYSLYSKPARGPPPIVNLARQSGLKPRRFILESIINPLVEQSVALALGHGLVGEPHEQNVLMELRHGRPSSTFWYRDLSGYHINPRLRRAAGKDMSFLPAGVALESLRSERADLIDNLRDYLGRSNLYALRKAFEPYESGVTKEWVDGALKKSLAQALARRTGIAAENYREMAGALSEYLRRSERS